MGKTMHEPDFLFEVSWEVCNKVGGIHTVVATKATTLVNQFKSNYITIGPQVTTDEAVNPEFKEDHQIFNAWRRKAENEGLKIKIGRWKINGHPIAIIIDFMQMVQHKDKIFAELWEKYKLDSISGQWDYIEPAIFGYTAGKVIESFIHYNLGTNSKIVAHFHEWMTGTGILYLKSKLPQVANIFTTHATTLGRALAGNNKPLYKDLYLYNSIEVAKEFNIISKYSLEKLSAQNSDCFTTVSEITAKECDKFLERKVDIVTPNGFENNFVPEGKEFVSRRKKAREKLLIVANALLNIEIKEDAFLIGTSGRYEFKNKGIDLFIDSISEIAKSHSKKEIIAFLLIPANHYGARKDLLNKIENAEEILSGSRFLTHNLHDPEWDPILNRIKIAGLKNEQKSNVKIIFVPSYLNGNDGIFNMPYYDLLIGLDLSIFTSYYEPWGYTPLESIAFYVPTITTTLAGFGIWAKEVCEGKNFCDSITVIDRTDDNDEEVVESIVNSIKTHLNKNSEETAQIRENAAKIASIALWKSLISYYNSAYDKALNIALERSDQYVKIEEKPSEAVKEEIAVQINQPSWKRIIVKSKFPVKLKSIEELVQNMWWTWDDEAQELFKSVDSELWNDCEQNPLILFEQIDYDQLQQLSKNNSFVEKLNGVHKRFKKYISIDSSKTSPLIAYFSMEYGIHSSLKTYSGGLGVLAGDYLKEASDSKTNIVAIGLLYRYGYFTQMLTIKGEQKAFYDYQHFSKLPISPVRDENNNMLKVSIVLPGRTMYARIWLANIGRIKLYLLDTDFEDNIDEDRHVTHHLYGGSNENRLKQEMLLGIGGIRTLDILGIQPHLFHSNEGHSSFISFERIRKLIRDEKLSFAEAREIVRSSTLFTTHTPVPAGHDEFDEELMRKYIGHYPQRLKISWDELMALGRSNPNNWNEKFNMSFLAAHFAQDVNGVSMLHGDVTRSMFAKLWPGYLPEELHIGYVTNGIHFDTWTAKEWKKLYNTNSNQSQSSHEKSKEINLFQDSITNIENWENINLVPDKDIWSIKQILREKLIKAVKERFKENWIKRHEDPKHIMAINNQLSSQALTVVFARRFATYKRAHLLFRNLDRLAKLVNNKKKPVQFIFAGKAHPHDKAGQDLIKMIVEISKRQEFLGKILFLQNYDMNLAKLLVQGADVWLNTPTRPLEASGTSGEKAIMNGTLHFSVLDGWWVEGFQPFAGWALTNERTYEDQNFQDDLDAEIIYTIFEQEIIPIFYDRDAKNIPIEWIKMIKNSVTQVAPKFTTKRMLNDYFERYYNPLYKRSKTLQENDFDKAKELTAWKRRISRAWNNIEIIEAEVFNNNQIEYEVGQKYTGTVILDLNEISPEDVGVEIIISKNFEKLIERKEFKLENYEVDRATYSIEISVKRPGSFTYGIRIFPKHELLAHRQDISILRWIT